MRKSRLSETKQRKLREHFVAGTTARSVFFICQSKPNQNVVDGRQRAVESRRRAKLCENQIRLLLNQRPELVLLADDMPRLAPRAMVMGARLADRATLLEGLLDHAQ